MFGDRLKPAMGHKHTQAFRQPRSIEMNTMAGILVILSVFLFQGLVEVMGQRGNHFYSFYLYE